MDVKDDAATSLPRAETETRALTGSVLAALNARDVDAIAALLHPDGELRSRISTSEGRSYRGREGFRDYFRDVDEAFDGFHWELHEIVGWYGDDLVIVLRATGRGRTSGAPIDQLFPQVWRFKDGKPWRNTVYHSLEEALAATNQPRSRRSS